MKSHVWNTIVCLATILILLLISIINYIIDPFVHFHKMNDRLQYPLKDERYINDGLQRNYEYSILVTGTSMSQNINVSKIEELSGMTALKTAYSGATFHELSKSIDNALSYNDKITRVICSLDPSLMDTNYDEESYEGTPEYLYDNNPFNDVNYVLNKDVITKSIAVINYTKSGKNTPDKDTYGRFDIYRDHGKDAVFTLYLRKDIEDLSEAMDSNATERIKENVVNNYILLAEKYPGVEFDFFIPPYSYCYWDGIIRTNRLDYVIECEKYVTQILTEQPNIRVYAFDDWLDITTNLDYYSDSIHYNGDVCDKICISIFKNRNELSQADSSKYFDKIKTIYSNLEYDFE